VACCLLLLLLLAALATTNNPTGVGAQDEPVIAANLPKEDHNSTWCGHHRR
jgi:hypothetical protein